MCWNAFRAPHSITSSARASSVGHFEAERLRGLEIEHELEPGRLLHRQVTGPFTPEDAIDIGCCLPICLEHLNPIGHQSAACDKVSAWGGLSHPGLRTIGQQHHPHLRQILSAYAAYYNEVRTHLALDKDAPVASENSVHLTRRHRRIRT
jgi:hypothetical protein